MILVVEDQMGIRRLLKEIFSGSFEVIATADGREALTYLQGQKPDLVLLDISLPDLSGLQVLREITMLYPKLPVIMMSAHSDQKIIEEAIVLGAQGYITKPFDIIELLQIVGSVLK